MMNLSCKIMSWPHTTVWHEIGRIVSISYNFIIFTAATPRVYPNISGDKFIKSIKRI